MPCLPFFLETEIFLHFFFVISSPSLSFAIFFFFCGALSSLFLLFMERHVADTAILAAAERESKKKTRHSYTSEIIKEVTDLARHHGIAGASRMYHQSHPAESAIPENTIFNWLHYWRESNPHAYFSVKKRGRSELMTTNEKADLLKGLALLRSAKKAKSVTARLVSSAGKGIIEKGRPAVLKEHGGPVTFSKETARQFLLREGFSVKCATTDRTVSEEDIVAAAEVFYAEVRLQAIDVAPELLLNFDEFRMLLLANRKWTWQRKTDPSVPMRGASLQAVTECSISVVAEGVDCC